MYSLVQKPISEVFNIAAPAEVTVGVRQYDEKDRAAQFALAHVPKQEPYLFRPEMVRDILAWFNDPSPEPILLTGPTGCGKSSLIKQIANRLQIPVWTSTGNEEMEIIEIFGQMILGKEGNMVYMDGPATQAAKFGGWYMIDEIDRLRPGVTVGLNGYLEGGSFTLAGKGGEVVKHQPGSRIIATANTNMAGDDTGSYMTAQIHDKSVLERFGMIIECEYADDDQERGLIANAYAGVTDDQMKYWFAEEGMEIALADGKTAKGEFITRDDFINTMLKFRETIRQQSVESGNAQGNAFERTLSTRSLLRWAKLTIMFSNSTKKGISALHYALERALTNGCTATSKIAMHQLLKSHFGVDLTLN